jgi:hypothetical protein
MTIHEIEFTTVDTFLDYLRPSASHWNHTRQQDLSLCDLNGWIFRGQSNAEWFLTPTAFRGGEPIRNYAQSWINRPQGPAEKTSARHKRQYAIRHAASELNAVKDFIRFADQLGIETSLDDSTQRIIEKFWAQTNASITRDEKPPETPPLELRAAFALAQHHGIQTRLLDWTSNALTAAFFAAYGNWEKDTPSQELCIWALNANQLSSPRIEVFTTSYAQNTYLKSQAGWFSYDKQATEHFISCGEWPSQELIIAEQVMDTHAKPVDILRKLKLPTSLVPELLIALYKDGINPATLMPTLDKVTETFSLHQKLFKKSPYDWKEESYELN